MNFGTRASALAVVACLATPSQADFSVSPRFYLYFDNASQRSSGFDEQNSVLNGADEEASQELSDFFGSDITVETQNPTSAAINNQQVYPLFGGAFTAMLGADNRTQITVSALYGTANSEFKTLQTFER